MFISACEWCIVCAVVVKIKFGVGLVVTVAVVTASCGSAFISRLNSMHVSFLMFCFSAVCFFINVSFRAVVSALRAFLFSQHSTALYCFYCIVSVLPSVL